MDMGKSYYIAWSNAIGTGAVIGIGSVATKDANPYSIVAGNPAIVIGTR